MIVMLIQVVKERKFRWTRTTITTRSAATTTAIITVGPAISHFEQLCCPQIYNRSSWTENQCSITHKPQIHWFFSCFFCFQTLSKCWWWKHASIITITWTHSWKGLCHYFMWVNLKCFFFLAIIVQMGHTDKLLGTDWTALHSLL